MGSKRFILNNLVSRRWPKEVVDTQQRTAESRRLRRTSIHLHGIRSRRDEATSASYITKVLVDLAIPPPLPTRDRGSSPASAQHPPLPSSPALAAATSPRPQPQPHRSRTYSAPT